jgi:predicted RNase H-like nuclease (RuvC/YqgF family)
VSKVRGLFRYRVSQTTYYNLRNRFLEAGVEGFRRRKTKSQELQRRIKELEMALGRKNLEVDLLKKDLRLLGEN